MMPESSLSTAACGKK